MFPLPTPFLITSLKYLLHFLSTFTPNLLHSKNLLRYFAVFCDTFSLKKNVCKPWFQANFSIFSSALFCCQRWGINIIIPHRWTEIISLDKSFFRAYNSVNWSRTQALTGRSTVKRKIQKAAGWWEAHRNLNSNTSPSFTPNLFLIFDNLAIVGCDVVAHVNRAGVLSDTHEGKQCELLMN